MFAVKREKQIKGHCYKAVNYRRGRKV